MRGIEAARLTLITVLAGLATAACGAEEPAIRVSVVNQVYDSIYVPANYLPLRIKDQQGSWWQADLRGGVACADCSEACEGTLKGDPAPAWVQVRRGQTLPLGWDGTLYQRSGQTCSCGIGCHDQAPISPGKYTFELSFDQALPPPVEALQQQPDPRWHHDLVGRQRHGRGRRLAIPNLSADLRRRERDQPDLQVIHAATPA